MNTPAINIPAKNITGILLAAGHSRRFSQGNKLLYPLQDGRPTALVAAQNLIEALPSSVAIIRPDEHVLAELLEKAGLKVLMCNEDQQEMADSLAAAARYLANPTLIPDGVVVALADMPFIQPQTILRVAEELVAGAGIVVPVYQQQRGHPVGFHQRYLPELEALQGDEGARSVLQRHGLDIRKLESQDPGIVADIDTLDDAQRLLTALGS